MRYTESIVPGRRRIGGSGGAELTTEFRATATRSVGEKASDEASSWP